jgi:23S rRNA (adenine2503-C2)-methyltransferase
MALAPWLELSDREKQSRVKSLGLPKYRAKQIDQWIFGHRATDFSEMTNLPISARAELAEHFSIFTGKLIHQSNSPDGTIKLLIEWPDGGQIETVLLKDNAGHQTVCLSSQVGCAMGCCFCASGLDGIQRNLTPGEIIEQVLLLQQRLDAESRISHIVVMGMGEPLANLDSVLKSLDTISQPDRLGIGARRITISTIGLPSAIRRLADSPASYHLAVSLHAPNDKLRDELVPANRKAGIAEILDATDYYFEQTGRRVTFEYVLLAGVNDQDEMARELARLLRGRNAMVNLIPYNRVAELPFETPRAEVTKRFADLLTNSGINVQTRYRKGDSVDAACGQLRRRNKRND